MAQSCETNYKVIGSADAYREMVKKDPGKRLVRLEDVIPGLVTEFKYATAQNFTHAVLYYRPLACLHPAQAVALKQVQVELNKSGLALKLYDAYRPFSVTCRMWRLSPDRRYTANPRKGSNHNRGIAVDVTLINLKTGRELDMGTAFDNFTDSAHHNYYGLPTRVIDNRRLLRQTMRRHGFTMVPDEWWHYQWHADRENFELVDIDFDVLKGLL